MPLVQSDHPPVRSRGPLLAVHVWVQGSMRPNAPSERFDSLFKVYADWDREPERGRFIARVVPLDWQLLKAQCLTESALDPDAVSVAGAKGLAQFMPATWDEWSVRKAPRHRLDVFNPEHAVFLQAAYMQWLLALPLVAQDLPRCLAAYNWGIGHLTALIEEHGERWGQHAPPETRDYIRRVLARYDALVNS